MTTSPGPLVARLRAWPRPLLALVAATLALLISVAVFPPRVQLFSHRAPRYQEWSRADTFLKQCEHPFRHDIEPAMRWRLLPPLVCRAVGLTGPAALVLPWLGLFGFLALSAQFLARATDDPVLALLGSLGLATTGAVITSTNWLGINDGWYLLGIIWVTLGRSRASVWVACLVFPWVDERFLIALPLALLVRATLARDMLSLRIVGSGAIGCGIYVAVRLVVTAVDQDASSLNYTAAMLGALPSYVAFVPIGWWMGLRATWVLIAIACAKADRFRWLLIVTSLLTLVAITLLAWDLSRSTLILLPAFVAGIVGLARAAPHRGRLILAGLVLANLALPFSHVAGFTMRRV